MSDAALHTVNVNFTKKGCEIPYKLTPHMSLLGKQLHGKMKDIPE